MPLTRMENIDSLASEYAQACVAIQPLWLALLRAYPDSPERHAKVREYNDARRRVDETKSALLTYARAGASEVGT